MKTKIVFIGLVCFLGSCSGISNDKSISAEDYSIELNFSSFFDCGVFERIVITSVPGKLTYQEKFRMNELYKIQIKDNCKVPSADTVIVKTSKIQRDSLFYLVNDYLESVKFNSQIKLLNIKEGVSDGANVEIRVCYQNQCKSYEYYHYGDFEKISPKLNIFMNYVNKLK